MDLRALLALIFWCPLVVAKLPEAPPKQSKYEAGVALGAFYLPDYPGAEESRARFIGLPYLFYRGDVFRADGDGGVRGRLLNRDRIEFDFSAEAAFPTNSDENRARQGMEGLDWIGEIGPRFVYHIYRRPWGLFDFKLPLRYVFSTDLDYWKERGFTVNPQLSFKRATDFDPTFFITAKLEGTWATKKLMDYIFTVNALDATPDRPEYKAQSGYLTTTTSISFLKAVPDKGMVFFTNVSWNFYNDAANKGSPLLKDEATVSYAAGVAWSFYKSEEKED